ncbi:ABC transporter ATP-binding protein [Fibrella aquatilis]|uniref:ABC transporter ATP-binding protein n=1 Tax=Fibrella aquatilis TaxID=2817059 RepID=A0A939G708_9BACT|nr:ABC transporter ATP-binding protein [Fibrella aquatilis]MBO0933582.1 ABC transporter ATP-binding protein [Fibrella aquatilis]
MTIINRLRAWARKGKKPASPQADEEDALISFQEQLLAMSNLPRFFKLVWETSPVLTLLNVLLRALRGVLPFLILYVAKLLIDEIVLLHGITGPRHLEHLWLLIGAEMLLVVISDASGRLVIHYADTLNDLFATRNSVMLMEHAAQLDLVQFEDSTLYDKLDRARNQTQGRTALLGHVLHQLQDISTMIFLVSGLVTYNAWLLVLLVLAVIPTFIAESYFNRKSYSLITNWTPQARELQYLCWVASTHETAKEIKIFDLSDFLVGRYKTLAYQYYNESRVLSGKRALWSSFFAVLSTLAYYAAFVYIAQQTAYGVQSIGSLTFIAGTFRHLKGIIEEVVERYIYISRGALYLKNFYDFLAITPTIRSNPLPLPFPQPIQEGFVFENVGFRYKDASRWAIRNLSFTLRAGERLALVGENGAGKTTVVKLLARLYEPTEGRILLDGHDLSCYDAQALRREIGVIFQDFVKYQMSFSDNIGVGNVWEKDNKAWVTQSARQSLADTVVDRLPNGYEQMLGRQFASGVELSGGEWQKVALGRAYMRDAQLVILDEPTAALDPHSEYEVFLRFASLTEGKMSILISHRFSTVRMADRILLLENGCIKELGSHQELLEQNGTYAYLFNLQAQGYQ